MKSSLIRNNHVRWCHLTSTTVQEDFLLLKVTFAFTRNQNQIQEIHNAEAVVDVGIAGGQTRNRIQVEANGNDLTDDGGAVHDFEFLERFRLDRIVGAAGADELLSDECDLSVLEIEVHDLEGDLAEHALLQVEHLLVVLELDVQQVVDADLHGDGLRAELLLAEPRLAVVGIGFALGACVIDLANPDFFAFDYIFEGAVDGHAHDVGDLGVDAAVRFVLLVFLEGEVEVGGLVDGGGVEGLVAVEELELVFLVAEGGDDADELDDDALVGVAALGAEGDDALDGLGVLEDVHLLGGAIVRVVDGGHLVGILAVVLEFDVATVDLFEEASQKRFLFFLGRSLMIKHFF